MAGERTKGHHSVAPLFDINTIVTQNILESELAAKLLEIDPRGHGSLLSFVVGIERAINWLVRRHVPECDE
jgi:hypothetical protein